MIQREFISIPRAQAQGAIGVYNLFKKAWGKETIDGIQVYTHGMPYVISNTLVASTAYLRFLKKIGITQQSLLSKSYDGIEVALFWLNTGKANFTPKLDVDIAIDINNNYAIGDEIEVSVRYGGDLKRYVPSHWSTLSDGSIAVDTASIQQELFSDPLKYFANIETVPSGEPHELSAPNQAFAYEANSNTVPSTIPVVTIDYNPTTGSPMDTIALLDDGTTFEKIGIRNEVFKAVETTDQYGNIAMVGEYSFIVKYRYKASALSSSTLVTRCKEVSDALAQSLVYNGNNKYKIVNHGVDSKIKEAIYLFNSYTASSPIFHNGRLRVDAVAAMKKKDFVKLLSKIFDHAESYTDNSHWYDIVIAIVIVIVAIVIIVLTWYAGGTYGWATLAEGLAYASAFMSIATLIYANMFPDATSQIRALGKVTQVIGYAAAITNIANMAINSTNIMQQATAVLQAGSIVAELTGNEDLSTILKLASAGTSFAGSSNAFKNVTFSKLSDGTASFSDITEKFATEVVASMKESANQIVDKVSTINTSSVITQSNSITIGDVSGWIKNLNTAMNMYMSMFTVPYQPTIGSELQSNREDAVNELYALHEILYENDMLDNLDMIMKRSGGDYQIQQFMSSIY